MHQVYQRLSQLSSQVEQEYPQPSPKNENIHDSSMVVQEQISGDKDDDGGDQIFGG